MSTLRGSRAITSTTVIFILTQSRKPWKLTNRAVNSGRNKHDATQNILISLKLCLYLLAGLIKELT